MTETSYAAIPAGWYPDPRGTKQRRWWDGTSWTHALEAPPEPVAPAAPGYANLPGPGTPAYANLPGPAFAGRAPSASAPTVARALDSEPSSHEQLPTRRQLREAAALLEAQREQVEPAAPSPVYAMGPAVSATQQPQASFSAEQFRSAAAQQPAEQLTERPVEVAESPAISTVAAMTLTEAPVSATHTFVPAVQPVAAVPVPAVQPVAAAPAAPPAAPATPAAVPAAVTAPRPVLPVSAPVGVQDSSSVSLSNGPAYQPFGMSPKITTGTMEAPTSVNTLSVWLITLLPTVALGIAVALIRFAPDFYTPFTQGALAFVFAIAGVGLAVNDRRQLTLRSHQDTASPAWILLTPLAYLAARASTTKRQAGRGWAPALVFIALTAGAATLVYFSGLPIETFVVV